MKMLRSEYVIRFFGQRTMGSTHYLFLEYADGGELFDRIGTCNQGYIVYNVESEQLKLCSVCSFAWMHRLHAFVFHRTRPGNGTWTSTPFLLTADCRNGQFSPQV